jgi:hypothetical protein
MTTTRLAAPCALAILAIAGSARADDFATMKLAAELGDLIASETHCGMQFNQAAIERYIEEKVPDGAIGFTVTLATMIAGADYEITQMSGSQKTVQCTQARRVARKLGFID